MSFRAQAVILIDIEVHLQILVQCIYNMIKSMTFCVLQLLVFCI